MYSIIILLGIITTLSSSLEATPLTLCCPHKEILFEVDLAKTPREKAKGLMFRKSLPTDSGMLFSYPTPSPISMWMKNTYVPLDIIFMDDTGAILAIYEETTPHSLAQIGPVEGTVHALEVGAGTVKRHKITHECVLDLKNQKK